VSQKSKRVYPVERAGSLDNKIRRWLQNPKRILGPYVETGMTVLDHGCGSGFFSIEMARMVGKSGRVIASDLQDGMLHMLKDKIRTSRLEDRFTLHKCEQNRIGVSEKVDFVLAFYVVHEVPDQEEFFRELDGILNPNGQVLMVEPLFQVSRSAFEKTIKKARSTGFTVVGRPRVFLSRTAVLKRGQD
jgi:ubiquinone/menaquinone biosynthesis C-methylase UbiE